MANPVHRFLRSMVGQRPSILLLPTNARRRRCLEQPHSAPSARSPECGVVRRCHYWSHVHRQMGTSSAITRLRRLHCRHLRAHHRPQRYEYHQRRPGQPDRQEPTTGQSRNCNHLHLRLRLCRGLHSAPGLVPGRVSPV